MSIIELDQPQRRTSAQTAPNSASAVSAKAATLVLEDCAFLHDFPRQLAEFIDPDSHQKLFELLADPATWLTRETYDLLFCLLGSLKLVLPYDDMQELAELMLEWLDCYINAGGSVPAI